MAIRKIEYTVTAEGISPATVQSGGVQGEHRATELVFKLTDGLYQSLEALKGDTGSLVYRIDGYNGEGGVHRSDVGELTQAVSYPLEEWLTRCGGIIKAVLVISLIENDTTEMELYSFPAVLRLKSLPDGADVDGENAESMSTLAQVAKSSAETAVQSAELAVEAKDKTEQAKAALEDGTVWIFDGGDASSEADIKFVIDGEMSDTSENPVKNRVIKKYADAIKAGLEEALNTVKIALSSLVTKVDTNTTTLSDLSNREADYVVEEGTKGIWTYRKWNSGIAECWGIYGASGVNCSAKNYEGFYYSEGIEVDLPIDFLTVTECTTSGGSQDRLNFARPFAAAHNKIVFMMMCHSSTMTAADITVYLSVKGRWKEEEQ